MDTLIILLGLLGCGMFLFGLYGICERHIDRIINKFNKYKQQFKTKPDTFKRAYGLPSGIYNGQAKTLDDNTPKLRLEA